MPRFYFDVRDGVSISDTEGTELEDVRAARIAAAKLAAGILADGAEAVWAYGELIVSVRDETGLVLFTVSTVTADAAAAPPFALRPS